MDESTTEDSRRQSILKPRCRFPLQEVPALFPDDDTVTNTITRSRRVSFGRNVIKEFIVGSAVSTKAVHEYEQSSSASESLSDPSECSGPLDLALNKTAEKSTVEQVSVNIESKNPEQRARMFTESCINIAKSVFQDGETELTAIIIGAKNSHEDKNQSCMSFTQLDMSQASPAPTDFVPMRHPEIVSQDAVHHVDNSKFDFLDKSTSRCPRISPRTPLAAIPLWDDENEENIPPAHGGFPRTIPPPAHQNDNSTMTMEFTCAKFQRESRNVTLNRSDRTLGSDMEETCGRAVFLEKSSRMEESEVDPEIEEEDPLCLNGTKDDFLADLSAVDDTENSPMAAIQREIHSLSKSNESFKERVQSLPGILNASVFGQSVCEEDDENEDGIFSPVCASEMSFLDTPIKPATNNKSILKKTPSKYEESRLGMSFTETDPLQITRHNVLNSSADVTFTEPIVDFRKESDPFGEMTATQMDMTHATFQPDSDPLEMTRQLEMRQARQSVSDPLEVMQSGSFVEIELTQGPKDLHCERIETDSEPMVTQDYTEAEQIGSNVETLNVPGPGVVVDKEANSETYLDKEPAPMESNHALDNSMELTKGNPRAAILDPDSDESDRFAPCQANKSLVSHCSPVASQTGSIRIATDMEFTNINKAGFNEPTGDSVLLGTQKMEGIADAESPVPNTTLSTEHLDNVLSQNSNESDPMERTLSQDRNNESMETTRANTRAAVMNTDSSESDPMERTLSQDLNNESMEITRANTRAAIMNTDSIESGPMERTLSQDLNNESMEITRANTRAAILNTDSSESDPLTPRKGNVSLFSNSSPVVSQTGSIGSATDMEFTVGIPRKSALVSELIAQEFEKDGVIVGVLDREELIHCRDIAMDKADVAKSPDEISIDPIQELYSDDAVVAGDVMEQVGPISLDDGNRMEVLEATPMIQHGGNTSCVASCQDVSVNKSLSLEDDAKLKDDEIESPISDQTRESVVMSRKSFVATQSEDPDQLQDDNISSMEVPESVPKQSDDDDVQENRDSAPFLPTHQTCRTESDCANNQSPEDTPLLEDVPIPCEPNLAQELGNDSMEMTRGNMRVFVAEPRELDPLTPLKGNTSLFAESSPAVSQTTADMEFTVPIPRKSTILHSTAQGTESEIGSMRTGSEIELIATNPSDSALVGSGSQATDNATESGTGTVGTGSEMELTAPIPRRSVLVASVVTGSEMEMTSSSVGDSGTQNTENVSESQNDAVGTGSERDVTSSLPEVSDAGVGAKYESSSPRTGFEMEITSSVPKERPCAQRTESQTSTMRSVSDMELTSSLGTEIVSESRTDAVRTGSELAMTFSSPRSSEPLGQGTESQTGSVKSGSDMELTGCLGSESGSISRTDTLRSGSAMAMNSSCPRSSEPLGQGTESQTGKMRSGSDMELTGSLETEIVSGSRTDTVRIGSDMELTGSLSGGTRPDNDGSKEAEPTAEIHCCTNVYKNAEADNDVESNDLISRMSTTPMSKTYTKTVQNPILKTPERQSLQNKTYRVSVAPEETYTVRNVNEQTYTVANESSFKRTHSDSPIPGEQTKKTLRLDDTIPASEDSSGKRTLRLGDTVPGSEDVSGKRTHSDSPLAVDHSQKKHRRSSQVVKSLVDNLANVSLTDASLFCPTRVSTGLDVDVTLQDITLSSTLPSGIYPMESVPDGTQPTASSEVDTLHHDGIPDSLSKMKESVTPRRSHRLSSKSSNTPHNQLEASLQKTSRRSKRLSSTPHLSISQTEKIAADTTQPDEIESSDVEKSISNFQPRRSQRLSCTPLRPIESTMQVDSRQTTPRLQSMSAHPTMTIDEVIDSGEQSQDALPDSNLLDESIKNRQTTPRRSPTSVPLTTAVEVIDSGVQSEDVLPDSNVIDESIKNRQTTPRLSPTSVPSPMVTDDFNAESHSEEVMPDSNVNDDSIKETPSRRSHRLSSTPIRPSIKNETPSRSNCRPTTPINCAEVSSTCISYQEPSMVRGLATSFELAPLTPACRVSPPPARRVSEAVVMTKTPKRFTMMPDVSITVPNIGLPAMDSDSECSSDMSMAEFSHRPVRVPEVEGTQVTPAIGYSQCGEEFEELLKTLQEEEKDESTVWNVIENSFCSATGSARLQVQFPLVHKGLVLTIHFQANRNQFVVTKTECTPIPATRFLIKRQVEAEDFGYKFLESYIESERKSLKSLRDVSLCLNYFGNFSKKLTPFMADLETVLRGCAGSRLDNGVLTFEIVSCANQFCGKALVNLKESMLWGKMSVEFRNDIGRMDVNCFRTRLGEVEAPFLQNFARLIMNTLTELEKPSGFVTRRPTLLF